MSTISSNFSPASSSTGTIQASVGPISGINYQNLITALEASQQQQVTDLNNNIQTIQGQQAGYQTLSANLTPLLTSAQALGKASTFQTFKVQLSDPTQLNVTADSTATPGSYQFQALQLASNQVTISKGFVNESQQALGTGTLTISGGGGLAPQTLLDSFNGGQGVRRGKIQITDAAGHSTTVDLSNAYSVTDVLNAINGNGVASVQASTSGDHLVIQDASGGSGTLSVANVNGDHTASDLGIAQNNASGTITGQGIGAVTSNTLLSQINDGNGIRTVAGAPAIQLTLSDGTNLEVNLDGAVTVGDVLNDINNTAGNGGKLVASLSNGALQLTDTSGGSGAFTVADDNNSSVVSPLGLNVAAQGNTISGLQLTGGINSVLLRNLRGGQGITQTGQIQLTDRTGLTATVDLTGAQSLDQVLNAINSAKTSGGQKLNLSAQVDAAGDGIEVTDTSGSTSGNLVIQDVGGGTTASDLGIAVNAATSSVDSGRLNLQYVNQSTSLSTYAPGGGAIPPGSFTITDSAGNAATIDVTSATKTLGDLIQSINSASGIQVHAQLNDTGDGFELIDQAGGSSPLTVTDDGGQTAADLRIAGSGTPNGGGQSQITSRLATVIDITSTDTIDSIVAKIGSSGIVNASVLNDGSAFSPDHLALSATINGAAGQFFIDQSGIDLGFQDTSVAQNALLRVGSGTTGFIKSSTSNSFSDALPGLQVQALSVGQSPDTVSVSNDYSGVVSDLQNFVSEYNGFINQVQTLTKYDTTTNTGAALEGSPTVMNAVNQAASLVTQGFGAAGSSVRTLVDLGITVNSDGTLSLNTDQLQSALTNNPQDVSNFFSTATTGFAAAAQSTITAISDPTTGSFTLASNTLQQSITGYQNRIATLNQLLNDQEAQLVQQFAALETFIGQMQQQQQQIAQIAPLNVDTSSPSGAVSLA